MMGPGFLDGLGTALLVAAGVIALTGCGIGVLIGGWLL